MPFLLSLFACGGGSSPSAALPVNDYSPHDLLPKPAPAPVIPGPVFSAQPATADVAPGASATFTVSASGTGTLRYQWTRNGTPIAGATAASYTIAAVSTADSAAEYRVAISDDLGTVTSAPVTARIASPGVWLMAGQVNSDNISGDSAEHYRDAFGMQARFAYPQGLAVDGAGNVFVADYENRVLRMVSPAGAVTTPSMNTGQLDGGPSVVAAGGDGWAYMTTDRMVNRIFTLAPSGRADRQVNLPLDPSYTNEGGTEALSTILFMAADQQGTYYDVVDLLRRSGACFCIEEHRYLLRRSLADGTTRTQVLPLAAPSSVDGMAVDGAGNVYLSDRASSVVRKVGADGSLSVVAGQTGISASVDGDQASGRLADPGALGTDAAGNLYILTEGARRTVRKLSPGGSLSTVFSPGSPGWQALPVAKQLDSTPGFAVAPGGTLYMTYGNAILRIVPK